MGAKHLCEIERLITEYNKKENKRMRIPGTEDMKEYKDYLFHKKQSCIGTLIPKSQLKKGNVENVDCEIYLP